MAEESLFDKLQAAAYRKQIPFQSKESRQWFMNKVKGLRVKQDDILNDPALKNRTRPKPGRMFTYLYDPKHKDTLPYYDRFPLIIMVGPAHKGFYGVNLHYLPLGLRMKFLDGLISITNNKRFDETTRFKMSYAMLKSSSKLKYFKPCFKHYLMHHIESRVKYVEASEWEIAAFLPTARFRKSSASSIHRDSRRLIG